MKPALVGQALPPANPTPSRLCLIAILAATAASAQPKISPPVFGAYTAGDDYFLANYTQLLDYWHKVAAQSDRIKLEEIGKTAEGRPMVMAIITAPANFKNLSRYKEISQRLARAEGLTGEQARALATEGKAVVWIDGGLHANEVVPAQALFTETYDLLSRDDPETLRILNDDILLLAPINPDGMELVSNWYMRAADPKLRTINGLPRLYQKYVGHDNNRDSYIANQPETEAVNRQMYIEWIPQIMYNQHQAGPPGSVLFFSPFRDPFNYNQDPLVPIGIDLVSAAVHQRFLAEGKPGAVMRSNAPYSTWFNGGDRTTTGFHNQIGLLAEIIGGPTPQSIPMIATKLLAAADQPAPIGPRQEWHQRQSIDYLVSADRAILDIASKFREDFLFRIYRAGKNSIERGSQDTWTLTPKLIAAVEAAYAREQAAQGSGGRGDVARAGGESEGAFGRGATLPLKYWEQLHRPEARDPRGYILPADQPDFATATRFIQALQKAGVEVHRASAPFTVAGKAYPAGSYVVKAAQAFRPHVRDMFEPQDHPNDFEYPGGPPKRPYDITGYTLAYQMGVQFDRILDGFDGPFERLPGLAKTPPGRINPVPNPAGYLLSHSLNDAFPGTAALLASGEEVYWLKKPAGAIYIPAKPTTAAHIAKLASQFGLNFDAVAAKPQGEALQLHRARIGLWDRYGGSMESGHIRWMFEQAYPVPYELVYAPSLNAGNLKSRFDVLIFPDGGIPAEGGRGGRGGRGGNAAVPSDSVPSEYRNQIGSATAAQTIPALRRFVEEGGTIVTIGSSVALAQYLGLPVTTALTETGPDGTLRPLPNARFYVPGSVLETSVDNNLPVAYGLPGKVDVFFASSPAFRLLPEAAAKRTRPVAWYSSAEPLRSGWAWGQHYLNGAVAIAEAEVGEGKVYLFGPEITFRGQSHGTFKFLFNAIQLAGAKKVNLP